MSNNIIIGQYAGSELTEKDEYQFIVSMPKADNNGCYVYKTTMTPEEYNVINKVLKRSLPCHFCGGSATIIQKPNPYMEEIYGDTKPVNLCDNCYQFACQEI